LLEESFSDAEDEIESKRQAIREARLDEAENAKLEKDLAKVQERKQKEYLRTPKHAREVAMRSMVLRNGLKADKKTAA